LFKFKTKRVIPIGKETIEFPVEKESAQLPSSEAGNEHIDVSKIEWEAMNLAELSHLDSKVIKSIGYEIKKTKLYSSNNQPINDTMPAEP
jgi:hypothetical protein